MRRFTCLSLAALCVATASCSDDAEPAKTSFGGAGG